MPFSSITDPDQLARVERDFRAAVIMVAARIGAEPDDRDRQRLAYLVAGLLASNPGADADIASLAAERFLRTGGDSGTAVAG